MRTNLIKKVFRSEKKELSSTEGLLDMVIAFDTTGSMSSYIKAVKDHVKSLVPELLSNNPNMKIGIVAFGDYCDMESSARFGKAYQVLDLTDDENKLIKFITNARNTSGGDGDEFYELVIKKITEETSWREGSTKSVLLIADASPHRVGYSYYDYCLDNQINWREEAKKSAELGIKWDTLSITNLIWYEELSKITNGVHSMFKSSSKTNDLIRAAVYSRGGDYTKEIFAELHAAASSDVELNSVFTEYSKELS